MSKESRKMSQRDVAIGTVPGEQQGRSHHPKKSGRK
jgi:hypothetical protein